MLSLLSVSLFLLISCSSAAHIQSARAPSQCTPLHTTFPPSSVDPYHSVALPAGGQFVALSPDGSYKATSNGLQLFLNRPSGSVKQQNGVNSEVATGATINSTFTVLYGKVTFVVSAPLVSGIVTATILIADERDEIDVEILGGDPTHWQTNVYAPASPTEPPLWGVFSQVEDIPNGGRVGDDHSYTIDWNADRIIWSVDGRVARTLMPEQTRKNGRLHYPSHATRIQLGIWDASSPAGTAAWAKGPVDWTTAPYSMTAVIKSVTVECPT